MVAAINPRAELFFEIIIVYSLTSPYILGKIVAKGVTIAEPPFVPE
jgi:hypothetical protein